jgi:hypothetical protein
MTSTTEYKVLFNPEKIQTVEFKKKAKSETIKMEYQSKIRFYCFELGSARIEFTGDNNLPLHSIPIQDIISTKARIEKKRFGEKRLLVIETANDIIDIEKMSAPEIYAFRQFLDIQKEKMVLGNKSKKITFTAGGSTKTCTIYPYSPFVLPDEEIISEMTLPENGFVVTNYRVWKDHFFNMDGISLTHDEYDEVIATNVQRRMMTKITTRVDVRTDRNLWNLMLGPTGQNALGIDTLVKRKTQSEIHRGTSDSTETEFGDVIFMKDGKRVMVWESFPDPNSTVNLINSAKAHFSTAPTASSSGGEDPIKALKLRFAKGEITKKQFLEMKKILE